MKSRAISKYVRDVISRRSSSFGLQNFRTARIYRNCPLRIDPASRMTPSCVQPIAIASASTYSRPPRQHPASPVRGLRRCLFFGRRRGRRDERIDPLVDRGEKKPVRNCPPSCPKTPERPTIRRGVPSALHYPLTPPEVRPATRCFSMHRNRMTTGMVAKMEVANRYCHLMKLKP